MLTVIQFLHKTIQHFFLQISTGQRYSVLLKTKSKPTKEQYTIQLETRERPTVTRGFAVLNYGPAITSSSPPIFPPPTPPLTLPNTTLGFLDYELTPHHSSHKEPLPTAEEVTRRVTLTVHQAVLTNGPTIWLENSYPWTNPSHRTLPRLTLQKRHSRIPLHVSRSSQQRPRSHNPSLPRANRRSPRDRNPKHRCRCRRTRRPSFPCPWGVLLGFRQWERDV